MKHGARLHSGTVLDVGVGYGERGFLIREMLDRMPGRHARAEWQACIAGLEAFEGYRSPLYGWVYDEVIYADIATYAETCPAYDLVMMGDVIEHLTKETGLAVWRTLVAKCRKAVNATPDEIFQTDELDNHFDQHRSLWGTRAGTRAAVDMSAPGCSGICAASWRSRAGVTCPPGVPTRTSNSLSAPRSTTTDMPCQPPGRLVHRGLPLLQAALLVPRGGSSHRPRPMQAGSA